MLQLYKLYRIYEQFANKIINFCEEKKKHLTEFDKMLF